MTGAVDLLLTITAWTATVVWALYLWDILVSIAGFWALPLPPEPARKRRFAVLICAHDEAAVIGGVIRSLFAVDYPDDLYEVFVVADNCSDDTAEVARGFGANVLVRHDPERKTKGFAMQWAMGRLVELGGFDALCVFDADNLADRRFLAVMNAYLEAGHVAIQGYLDTKNPDDTWVTRAIALAYFVTNRLWLRARARLGLPATLGGTGLCLSWPVVEKYRWDPGSLCEDLELTMKLVHDGLRVSYTHHTRTFDEKPATLRACLRQRTRWMSGHNDIALRWAPKMLWAAVTRLSPRCFDATLHLLQPIRVLLAFTTLVVLVAAKLALPLHPTLDGAFRFSPVAIGVFVVVFVIYPVILAIAERVPRRGVRDLVPFMLLAYTWIPAVVVGILRMRRREWVHTRHGAGASGAASETKGASLRPPPRAAG